MRAKTWLSILGTLLAGAFLFVLPSHSSPADTLRIGPYAPIRYTVTAHKPPVTLNEETTSTTAAPRPVPRPVVRSAPVVHPVAVQAATRAAPAPPRAASGGSCYGLDMSDYRISYIINRESHCNPRDVNPSSGACGIGQLKSGCYGYDGYAQAAAMVSYVNNRYGGWDGAYAHEVRFGWY